MAYYRHASNESEQFLDIFAEFDFECVSDGCNFFCPECREILNCEVYRETKETWDSFFT